MASYVAKKAGRKFLGAKAAEIEPQDPHYETYEDARGKQRKRKRAMPQGLSKRDERVLRSVRRRAHYLDKGFSICGFRFGWTAVLGLIPGAGDIAQFLLGFFLVLRKCKEAELPASLTSRMTLNQMIGLGIGLVPLVGDIGMAAFKANSRNAGLLEDFLIRRSQSGQANEEQLAEETLVHGTISKKTGELDSHNSGAEGRTAAAQAAQSGTNGKGYYGWGNGDATTSGGTPATTTTTTSTSTAAVGAGTPKKNYGTTT
ncbi:uncharacterized protein JCM6883_001309 [Sporobolomyces salmoneus]|uniref:uncharacterized protein n=1 Tax=Sporobolomyces salmoneus TaxID=183962 RepID=UPI00317B6CA8